MVYTLIFKKSKIMFHLHKKPAIYPQGLRCSRKLEKQTKARFT